MKLHPKVRVCARARTRPVPSFSLVALVASALAMSSGVSESSAAETSAAAPSASAATAESAQPGDESIVTLSPFEVRADTDNSYGALQSNSLTAFSVDLQKMPATAQVFTQTFIDDVGATSIENMLADYSGTVGYNPNNAAGALDMTGDRDGGQGLGIRGLQASGLKRDGFIGMKNSARTSTGNTDNFSIERVELIEGPQSLLYGAVGGGGVINTVSKRALFSSKKGSVKYTLDQYGSKRGTFDYNYGLEKLAFRFAGTVYQERTARYNLSNQYDFKGLYVQAAYRITSKITLRLLGERNSDLSVFNTDPSFNAFFPAGDIRTTSNYNNSRYLALTGQLASLTNVVNGGLDYGNFSSLYGWWESEKINNDFLGASIEGQLGAGFSAKIQTMYSETSDARSNAVNSKALLPAKGLPGAGSNPFTETAISLGNVGYNEQLDRTKGVQFTLLHEGDFKFGPVAGHSRTAFGAQISRQGPSFGSSGWDVRYYQADDNWNAITSSTIKTDYGRVQMPTQYWTVQSGIQLKPLFQPGKDRVVVNGVKYVAERRIKTDPAYITADNPWGVVPNAPTTANPNAFNGNWNPGGYTRNRLLYIANVTDWLDGRLTTMAGFSVNTFDTVNFGSTSTGVRTTILPSHDYNGYSLGANYGLKKMPNLRFYATVSTAGLSAGTTKDFYGNSLKVPDAKAPVPEVGIKWVSHDGRYSAQVSYDPTTKETNETQNAGTDYFNAVNPSGINGRFNGGDQWINVDRKASAAGLVVTASPTRNWRMRFSATKLDGEISSTVQYNQLYNDQFFLNNGVVTYSDKTPVMVDPAGGSGAKTAQLTLAMINDSTNPYYANPDPNSGRITNSTLINTLIAVDPVRGQAATGVTGLPISSVQYTFANPHGGLITVVKEGEKNTGINEYSFNFQSHYTFSSGPLDGLAVFFDVRSTVRNRAYYTTHVATTSALDSTRELFRMPDNTVFGLGVNYKRRLPGGLDKVTWTTQLNIQNLFDNSKVWIMPNVSNADQFRARLSNQPRLYIWSNTFSF